MAPRLGLSFTETMRGFVGRGEPPGGDYRAAERSAERARRRCRFTLTIDAADLDQFLDEPSHTAAARGRITVDGFTGPEGSEVVAGSFNLFVDAGAAGSRRLLYALPFVGIDGRPYLLDGFKEVGGQGRLDVWGATTTLYTVIRQGHGRDGAVVGSGIVRVHLRDLLRQLATFEVHGARSDRERLEALARFGRLFFGTLFELFVRPRLPK